MAMGLSSSRRATRRGRRAPMAEINVTPFVDVMLVLLIIFMVTAPLLASGVPIELPESRANALPAEQDPLTISVGRDGVIYLDNAPVSASELPARLANIANGPDGNKPQVTLRGDQSINYGMIMAVMGELNRAGFNSIAMVTRDTSAPPASTDGEPAVSDGSATEQ
ncbi:ExbD/TolR family protein [Pontixanthobacter aquaemixtae]|uniref:Protein TolR n=1 Tax=Pontixanthobacter aquaemixtae TaxID=1958940 RepID=A0A844ZW30_9SPHN|nr:ExbD/TolR family protein [Pontixanthobacter aquaemixtae]MXO91938.1 protein TolR [Pontixanthobacter aquaemixtae]